MKKSIPSKKLIVNINNVIAIIILLCSFSVSSYSQPLQLGQSVVTSHTFENDPTFNVVRVIDLRNRPPFVAAGTYWNAPAQYFGANWTKTRMRNVFGIAIEDGTAPNIFVSSSAVNCVTPDPNDTGLVYRLDGSTWLATNYITSTFAPGPPIAGTGVSTMPNTGPRIGNICYDKFHNQLFTTNLEDGIIYRITDNAGVGNVVEFYDPFTPDNGLPGYAPLGERLWGIGAYGTNVNDVKIYFSRWNVDINLTGFNEIWSVALNSNGSINTASLTLEITLPVLPGYTGSSPVADIEFSFKGDMLLGERSMIDICSSAHVSRMLEYARDISGNYLTYIVHPIGLLINAGINPNSTGGVDFSYGNSDTLTGEISDCDSVIVGTGDYLFMPPSTNGGLVYGVQMSNRSPSWISNTQNFSNFIDINNNLFGGDKSTPGDIDVYRQNLCPDSSSNACMTILRDTVYCDSNGTYIYEFQVKNNSGTQSIEQLEIGIDSPQPPNYVVAVPSFINVYPLIPPGGASQVYRVKLIGPGAVAYSEVCYTLSANFQHSDCPWCCYIENCIKLPICSCAEVLQDSIYCVDDNYFFNFTLKNGTQYSVTKLQLTSPGSTPITFIPQIFHFGTPIPPGQVFPNLTAQFLGGAAGMNIPIRIKLFAGNFECCYFEIDYRLPPCDTMRLNLASFIEGRYDPDKNIMNGDYIDVELRNSFAPYSLVETATGYLNETGNCRLEYYTAENNINYFIVVKHKNSVETWSKSPGQSFTNGDLNFDFLSSSQAYGNNLVLIDSDPVCFGILSGDADQDRVVDLADILLIFNDSKSYNTGVSDINGDGVTDLTDIMLSFNNAYKYVSVLRP